jgi:hypothetical protein
MPLAYRSFQVEQQKNDAADVETNLGLNTR